MRPGQQLYWSAFSYEDEGYSKEERQWLHEDGLVLRTVGSSGTDCDGSVQQVNEYAVELSALDNGDECIKDFDANGEPIFETFSAPAWRRNSGWQRDAFAEAAGY